MQLVAEEFHHFHASLNGQVAVLLRVGEVVDVFGPDPQHHLAADRFGRLALHRRAEEAGIGGRAAPAADDLGIEEVHRRRSDEAGDEEIVRTLVKILRCVQLLELSRAHHGDAIAHRHRLDLVVRHIDGGATKTLMELLQHRARLDT